ncbi:hypothetical protein [Uliginosibacterium gangwonense]|uniref:hypothetical protein n=1 Tax=Uliginosibacterium gangwonense TaxID=392736 RepID=UPI000368C434|nr:hypothetical protein [Uliginosibacterium gangwonense]
MLQISKKWLAVLALVSGSAYAGSVSMISVSDSISATVEGISTASSTVGKSSAKLLNLAEGDYKVVDVAQAQEAGKLRLTLHPVDETAAGEGFYLYVVAADVEQAQIRQGDIVSAKLRPYGVAVFGQGKSSPFALVLDEAWRKQILPQAITG